MDRHGEVIGCGCNDLGKQPWTPEQLEDRDWKYNQIGHAERTALMDAARVRPTAGGILVCPWACCGPCGWAIGRMGVKKLYVHKARQETTPDRWKVAVEDGLDICRCYGVDIVEYDGRIDLPEDFTIKANGEDWSPVKGEVCKLQSE